MHSHSQNTPPLIGILCLDTQFPKPPGHLRNDATFPFAVRCSVLAGIGAREILSHSAKDLEPLFVQAALQLEAEGVKAIAGSCGFMALFQQAVARAVRVPVFLSSLLQIPLIYSMHGASCRLGVLTANASILTLEHFALANVPESLYKQLHIQGLESYPCFRKAILEGQPCFDMPLLGKEICMAAKSLLPLDALLLECTDLSAFAHPLQQTLGIAIYDINSLMQYVAFCVERNAYPTPIKEELYA